jgi:hypothetical protein
VIRIAAALACASLAACLTTPTHHCADASDCGADEQCVAVAPDDLRCARPSEFCDSGLAWADDAGDHAGSCVDGGAPLGWNPCYPQPSAAAQTDTCATDVCAADPRCCTREWSETCVNLADRLCGLQCGAVAAFVGTGETWVGAWDGSDFASFWSDDVTGHQIQAVAWGDYDGDLLPDLATCEDGQVADSAIRIYHNDDAGNFSLVKAAPSGQLCWDIDWVDVDADGDLDVAATGAYDLEWVENDDGLWADAVTGVVQGFLVNTDWADIDGDGRMDAAVARYEQSALVLHNDGDPAAFSTMYDTNDTASAIRYESANLADVNAIGGLDLLLSGDSFVTVVPNTDSTNFAAGAPLLQVADNDYVRSYLVDLDGDGDNDVIAFAMGYGPLRVYRNNDNGGVGTGYTMTPLWDSGDPPFLNNADDGGMAIADVDGDHELDVVMCTAGDYCQMWLGTGDGSFTRQWDPDGARRIFNVALTSDWR